MNERDYTLIELTTMISGALGLVIWSLSIFLYKGHFSLYDLFGLFIMGIIVFFIALVARFKKAIYLAEMKSSLKEEKT